MRIVHVTARIFVYTLFMFILISSVTARRAVVTRERADVPITCITEMEKYGKPVTVLKVKSTVFDVKEKFTVVPVAANKFEGYVTRKMASSLREGGTVNALNGHSGLAGKISYISPEVDIMSGLYRLEIKFEEPVVCNNGKLLVETKVGEKENIIEVPNDALQIDNGKFYLWKVSGGKAHRTEVELAARSGYSSIVSIGLEEGDVFISSGQSQIEEGDKIRVIDIK